MRYAPLVRLEEWLQANPGQSLTIEYSPNGFAMLPDARVFRAKMARPRGSKIGWMAEDLDQLVRFIVEDAP